MGSVTSRLHRHQHDDVLEAAVCQASDVPDEGMKVCELGSEGRVLVVKHKGKISVLGTKCSHYGAPLDKGVLQNGRIRCPWHGACFSVNTGDIEDFPGLDSIPCYEVTLDQQGAVRVRAKKSDLQENKCSKQLCKRQNSSTDVVLVVGGGGAGATCVEALRQNGYRGRLVLATREKHLPYDRPKLSKALDMSGEKLQLRTAEFYKNCDVEVLTEREVVSVDPDRKSVQFSNGSQIEYTHMVWAAGSRPRRLDAPGADLENVSVLRSPEDGNLIASQLQGRKVVIVGSSFIGMEAAAYCVGKAESVVVIGASAVPFERSLGPRIGSMIQAMHEEKGVRFMNKQAVKEFCGENGKLTKVVLTDGSEVSADICLMGVGVVPNTDQLEGALDRDSRGHVIVDQFLRSSVPSIFAAGDVAAFPLPLAGHRSVSIGHWQLASYLGRAAGSNVAGKQNPVNTVPFFWTQMFGKSIRYAGYCSEFDDILYDGDVEQQKFVAFFCHDDKVQAVASMGRDPAASYWAEQMAADGYPAKELVQQQLANSKEQ